MTEYISEERKVLNAIDLIDSITDEDVFTSLLEDSSITMGDVRELLDLLEKYTRIVYKENEDE